MKNRSEESRTYHHFQDGRHPVIFLTDMHEDNFDTFLFLLLRRELLLLPLLCDGEVRGCAICFQIVFILATIY